LAIADGIALFLDGIRLRNRGTEKVIRLRVEERVPKLTQVVDEREAGVPDVGRDARRP